MENETIVETKADFGKIIWKLMARMGIKTAKELTDTINREAGKRVVSETSVGKWIAGKTVPKATSLMFLAKALRVSADLILFDEDSDSERKQSLRKIVAEVAKEEIRKLLKEKKAGLENELSEFLKSDKIPQEDKEALIRQARNLLKLYEKAG